MIFAGGKPQIGWFGEDIWDAGSDVVDFVGDAASSIVDNLGAALPIIGGIMKGIAPLLAFYPGIGTALAVALSAGGDLALGTPLDDLILDSASAAMPPGPPRLAFDAGADVTHALLRGEDVKEAAIRSGRGLAQSVGGDRAAQAYDAGVQLARGKRVDDATTNAVVAHYRATMVVPQGTEAIAAFDAGETLARGGDAGDAATIALRDYIDASGGKVALLAVDTGMALARGKSLQDAGFGALKNFVRGNDAQERALRFAEKMTHASSVGEALEDLLTDDLAADVLRAGGPLLQSKLETMISKIELNPALLEMGSDALAIANWMPEAVARAAQIIMADGQRNEELRKAIAPTLLESAQHETMKATTKARRVSLPYTKPTSTVGQSALQSASVYRAMATLTAPTPVELVAFTPDAGPIVEAPRVPGAAKTGIAGDLALGGVVVAAGAALFFWARSK